MLRPRTLGAIARARARGIRMIVATGRMFQAVRPYLEQAGLEDPVVCYQGAAVDPRTGKFLLHEPLALDLARKAIAFLDEAGHPPNRYVRDQLFVAEQTAYSRAYAEFQHIPVSEVGDLLGWIDQAPTKLVAVGEPDELALFADRSQKGSGRTPSSPPHCRSCSGRQRVGLEGNGRGVGGGTRRLCRRACGRVRRRRERSRATGLERLRHRSRERSRLLRERRTGSVPPRERGRGLGDRGVRRLTAVIDLKAARAEPGPWREALAWKGAADEFDALLEADARWRALVPRVDELRGRTKLKGKPTPDQLAELQQVKAELRSVEDEIAAAEAERDRLALLVPNSAARVRAARPYRGRRAGGPPRG